MRVPWKFPSFRGYNILLPLQYRLSLNSSSLMLLHSHASKLLISFDDSVREKITRANASESEWISRMRESCKRGGVEEAITLYCHMSACGIKPDISMFPILIKASCQSSNAELGKAIFGHILELGFDEDVIIATAIVDMFAKFLDIQSARKVFDKILKRDVASWNAMIAGYSRMGYVHEALVLFHRMLTSLKPNYLTISILLQVCADSGFEDLGRVFHGYVLRQGLQSDVFLHNSFLVMYNKCENIKFSERLFERMSRRDLVSWNVMISGYTHTGFPEKALEMFYRLQMEGLICDLITLEAILHACAQLGDIEESKYIHDCIVRSGYFLDLYADNSILVMYCKCGSVYSALELFNRMSQRNLVSWNVMIDGFVRAGHPSKALMMFKNLRVFENRISSESLVAALQAVKQSKQLNQGMCIHGQAIFFGFDSDAFVLNSIIGMYGACASITSAHNCFQFRCERNTITWNTMIYVYAENACFREAFELLGSMQFVGYKADAITLVNILLACTLSLDLKHGKIVHGYAARNGLESDVFVATSLLDLYAKCGRLSMSCSIFQLIPTRNLVTWNAMMQGCCKNGFFRESLSLFHLMQQVGLVPDVTSMVLLIQACSLSGWRKEGKFIHDYVIGAGLESNEFIASSLITMYSKFNDFDSAKSVFDGNSSRNIVIWNAMIAGVAQSALASQAMTLFRLLRHNDIIPDSVTFISVLPSCACSTWLQHGKWIHSLVIRLGYESDAFVGTCLLDVYAKCGAIDMARLVFDGMGIRTTLTWNAMLAANGIHGNVEEAHKLFSQMQKLGLDPDNVTFLCLLSVCRHTGEVEKGLQYFELMTKVYSIVPRSEHYACMVDLLSRGGLLSEALKFIEEISIEPTSSAWGSLLSACRDQGNVEIGELVSEKLFELNPEQSGYHMLLSNIYAANGRWLEAASVRMKLKERGVRKQPAWSVVETF
ncbi:hypothetical protein AMTRI_Chr02g215200 [Amborella trichopoda]